MINFITTRRITIYITLIIVAFNALWAYLYWMTLGSQVHMTSILIFILVAGIIGYLLIKFILEVFVFEKIKTIYKFINESNKSSSQKEILKTTSFAEVNEEVMQWAKSKEEEIQSLKSLETYRKNFVGNISHELKTPIFSIQGYLHTLLEGGIYDKNINIKYLERAAVNVQRLQNIVEDLEVISHLESDKAELLMTTFDLKKLTEECFHELELLAREKKISLEFKNTVLSNYSVLADKDAIRQVLTNLITNSIKYGKEEGKTMVGFYDIEENMLIEISDDGIGIDEKHLKHLFDRFYRVDRSRSRQMGGSGLGLSIVKHILEAHNQSVSVRSTVQEGSTFSFTLNKAN